MFKFKTQKDQMLEVRKKSEALNARQDKVDVASSIAFVTLAETGAIDDETATEHTDLFSPWAEGIAYEMGNIRSYEGELFRCVQAHTSQSDWTPDKVPALWVKIGDPTVEFPEWSQPVGAHDAYAKGDKVSHNNKHWISDVDNNVWEPGAPGTETLWKEI